MPRPVPAPDPLSKPFWDACNQGKLIIQHCNVCNRDQFPPQPVCAQCGWGFHLSWKDTSGRGTIIGYSVTYDTRTRAWAEFQPFNNAVVALEENPVILFHTTLPGEPADNVPVGSKVQVEFLEVEAGVKVPEWKITQRAPAEKAAAPKRRA